jgi:DNA-binding NarL/FixJ family response regulator
MMEVNIYVLYLLSAINLMLVAGGIAAGVAYRRKLHGEFGRLVKTQQEGESTMDGLLTNSSALSERIDGLQTRLEEIEERSGTLVPARPTMTGLNISSRTEALRLAKEGLDEEEIASELGLSQNEVELLLHVENHWKARRRGRRKSSSAA